MLPLSSGRAEPGRSAVSPISLLCAAAIWRVRVRFFSVTLGETRAGEYQADAAPAGVLRGAIVRWRRKNAANLEILEAGGRRARKGIWSKENESNEGKANLGPAFLSAEQLLR